MPGNRGVGRKAQLEAQHSEQKTGGDDPRLVELLDLFARLTERQRGKVLTVLRRLARTGARRRRDEVRHVSADGNAAETIVERTKPERSSTGQDLQRLGDTLTRD